MKEPIWLTEDLVKALHDRQVAEHGGTAGLRDQPLLESALARAQQLFAYGDGVDIPAMAAAYAYGISRNYAFLDANKRTATVCCEVFMELNNFLLLADDADFYTAIMSLATGEISEDQFTTWLRSNSRPEGVNEGLLGYGSD